MDAEATASRERSIAIRIIKFMLFSASVVPSCVGGALAFSLGHRDPIRFALVTLGLFLGQAAGDYLYYYFTHYHTDPRDAHTKIFAGWRPLFTDSIIPPQATIYAGLACLALAGLIGLYFFWQVGPAVLILAAAGGAVAVFFTPLMMQGYKEPVIFLTFGPLALTGVHLALTGGLSWTPLTVSLPIGFFVAVVAYLKGAHLVAQPGKSGQVTVDVRVEHIAALFVLGYICLMGAVALGVMPPWTLLALVSALPAAGVIRLVLAQSDDSTQYLWAVIRSIAALVVAGAGICVGYLI